MEQDEILIWIGILLCLVGFSIIIFEFFRKDEKLKSLTPLIEKNKTVASGERFSLKSIKKFKFKRSKINALLVAAVSAILMVIIEAYISVKYGVLDWDGDGKIDLVFLYPITIPTFWIYHSLKAKKKK
tara:strand:- start:358 stop:741 length:384 start_codon:yes stop_codon:yes gene_type:complete